MNTSQRTLERASSTRPRLLERMTTECVATMVRRCMQLGSSRWVCPCLAGYLKLAEEMHCQHGERFHAAWHQSVRSQVGLYLKQ